MKRLASGVLLVSLAAVLAAGCGGGNGSKTLSKDEYASKLSAICNDSNDKINALGITTQAAVKEKGDEAVAIGEDALEEFRALRAPNELRNASRTFNDSSAEILADFKAAVEAAKTDDAAGFAAAFANAQTHGNESDAAARQIGAADCVSG